MLNFIRKRQARKRINEKLEVFSLEVWRESSRREDWPGIELDPHELSELIDLATQSGNPIQAVQAITFLGATRDLRATQPLLELLRRVVSEGSVPPEGLYFALGEFRDCDAVDSILESVKFSLPPHARAELHLSLGKLEFQRAAEALSTSIRPKLIGKLARPPLKAFATCDTRPSSPPWKP